MSDDRQEPPPGDGPGDQTRPLPPSERPASPGPGPAPRVTATGRPPSAPWSGRAEVPPTRSTGYPEPAAPEWYAEDQGDRRWWMPILIASVALVILAVLGAGLWLIGQTEVDPAPTDPLPSPSVTAPSVTAPTTGPPTSTPTSVAPTTGSPTTDAPPRVPMPPLVGLPQSTAESLLDRLGLGYRVELRRSDRPAGTVIETDPAAGETVPAGSDVRLVVAEGGAETSPPVVTPTATATR